MPEPVTVPAPWHHRLSVHAHIGALTLAVDLELRAPWTVLFGPSGSGKSSLLRAMCGLSLADPHARITFERRNENESFDLTALPPHRRNLACAPQTPSLLPQLDVARNVRFPLEVTPVSSRSNPVEPPTLVEEAMTLFRLHALAARRPRNLSGGEAQRVNLARAFATPGVHLLLLDEPFNGIDRRTRDEILPAMRAHAAAHNLPVLSVTHDVEEALRLEAEVLRLDSGQITAQGPARKVLADEIVSIATALR